MESVDGIIQKVALCCCGFGKRRHNYHPAGADLSVLQPFGHAGVVDLHAFHTHLRQIESTPLDTSNYANDAATVIPSTRVPDNHGPWYASGLQRSRFPLG